MKKRASSRNRIVIKSIKKENVVEKSLEKLFSLPYNNCYFTSSCCFLRDAFEPRKIAKKGSDFFSWRYFASRKRSNVKIKFSFESFLFCSVLFVHSFFVKKVIMKTTFFFLNHDNKIYFTSFFYIAKSAI